MEFLRVGDEHKQQTIVRQGKGRFQNADYSPKPRWPKAYGSKRRTIGQPEQWAEWEAQKERTIQEWDKEARKWEGSSKKKNPLQEYQQDVQEWEQLTPNQTTNEPAWYPQMEEDPTWTPDAQEEFFTEESYGREGVQRKFCGQVHTEESDSDKENRNERPWIGTVDQVETEVWNTFFKAARDGAKEEQRKSTYEIAMEQIAEIDEEIQGSMWQHDNRTNTWTT
ncbi:hypothetical protein BC936DRAFT_149580 [Jimgerdemannia flammicorona]|uniref:Uncharacterized protein n=1 Tax=Jimgerdemannia flammicorona TaxID=994334 RepID=A0A433D0K4_9FUNG|nr:hypothetical protein BC936DRAFT_149580 [Jimgerdemannia flammicorona]